MAAAALTACAGRGAGPGAPDDRPEAEPRETDDPAARRAGVEGALARLDSLTATASAPRAARIADSLFFRWRAEPGLGEAASEALRREADALAEAGRPMEAAERLEELLAYAGRPGDDRGARAARELARLRVRLGRGPAALRLLDRRPGSWDEALLSTMRAAAREMSLAELTAASSLFRRREVARGLVAAERARVLALAGRTDSARAAARRVLEGGASAVDRETARSVARGEIGPADRDVPRIGLVLPLSGDLASVGRLLREAALVAAAADSVELVVRDDSSRASTVPSILRELERAGVTAVVGPVTSGGLRAAVRARSDLSLPLVSPTASTAPSPSPNVYTLWARSSRVRDLSRSLGERVPVLTGLRRTAILREASGTGRVYEHGFRSGARRGGGWVAAAGTFHPDSTTFAGPVRWLASNAPESLLVGAGDPRTVLQMAPQLSYYGLRTALVAGTSAWGQPAAVRRLEGSFPSRWLTAVFADRTREGTAWAEFRRAYERRYRKGLPPRQLPALAYDAVRWTAGALGSARLPRRGAVARGLTSGSVDGASGSYSARFGRTAVEREVLVRMAADGELHAPDTAALRGWRREAERLVKAGRRRRREEARDDVERWMRRHGDSVRVDSTRIRRREGAPPGEPPAGTAGRSPRRREGDRP